MNNDFYIPNDLRSLRDCTYTDLPRTADTILGNRLLPVILLTLNFCMLFSLLSDVEGRGDFLKSAGMNSLIIDSIFLCGILIWKLRIMVSYLHKKLMNT